MKIRVATEEDMPAILCMDGLTVYPDNPALNLYRKWGFVEYTVNMKRLTNGSPVNS